MLHEFTYNGKSSREMGIYIGNKSGLDMARRSTEKIDVPGRNGAVIIDNGSYENMTITYHALLDHREFSSAAEHLRKVKLWLSGNLGAYGRLTDTYDVDVYRMAAYIDLLNIKRQNRDFCECDIKFDTKPLRYLKSGDRTVRLSGSTALYNPTNQPAKPLIDVYGSGDITMDVNGRAYTLKGLTGHMMIDCEEMIAYDGVTSLNRKISGFPELRAGNNTISVSGALTAEIIPRWASL